MKRYSRNIALTEIGKDGQDILSNSSVLVIGAGGLGSPVMLYLAAAGVGTIGVVDYDRVELSNLQRQIIYNENSLGKFKVDEAKRSLSEFNSDIRIIKHKLKFGYEKDLSSQGGDYGENDASIHKTEKIKTSLAILFSNYDIIADCSDNFTTRFIINDTCLAEKKTLVSGAVTGFNGQFTTFKPYLGVGHPCYRCFCPTLPPEDILPNCISGGVLGSVAGIIGSLQATEIVKELLQIGESMSGSIIIYNGLKGNFRKVSLKKRNDCISCNINIK